MQLEISKHQHVTLRGNNLHAHADIAKTAVISAKRRFGIDDEGMTAHLEDDHDGIRITLTQGEIVKKGVWANDHWKWDEEPKAPKPAAKPADSAPAKQTAKPGAKTAAKTKEPVKTDEPITPPAQPLPEGTIEGEQVGNTSLDQPHEQPDESKPTN